MVVTVMDAHVCITNHTILGDSLHELATVPCTIQCDVAFLSPVLLWPEKVRGSCSVCVKAAVLLHFVAQYHQITDQSAVDECSRYTSVSALPPECSTGTQQWCRSVVAALAVWKLSQYLKSCNFGSMVAVLAVLCASALLCPLQSQLRHDMIRSRFQHSFVIQSVLHSYLVGFVLFCVQHCNYSHLPQCYFSASVPSLKCARARGMSSMSSCSVYYRAL